MVLQEERYPYEIRWVHTECSHWVRKLGILEERKNNKEYDDLQQELGEVKENLSELYTHQLDGTHAPENVLSQVVLLRPNNILWGKAFSTGIISYTLGQKTSGDPATISSRWLYIPVKECGPSYESFSKLWWARRTEEAAGIIWAGAGHSLKYH